MVHLTISSVVRTACLYSYFEHEWTGNEGMYYMTKKRYRSKTFTDYTHPMSEIISGLCNNGIVVTGLQEFDYDISGGFVLKSGDIEENMDFAAIISARRDELEDLINRALFAQ